jgi:hypothetical protein
VGFLPNGLGKNARPSDGYFNGVEIKFTVSGSLDGYTVSVGRVIKKASVSDNLRGTSYVNDLDDKPRLGNVFVSGNSIYSIDSPGKWGADVNQSTGYLSFQIIANFVETATIYNQRGEIVSQYSVEWSSSMSIGRSSPDGTFQYLGGSIGPGHVKIP